METNLRQRFRNFRSKQFQKVEPQQIQKELQEESTLDLSYLALIVSSCAIATFGLLSNSAAVIIGAMIIAPLMLPIRGLAFGALQGNIALFHQALVSLCVGILLAIIISCCLGKLVSLPTYGSEILGRSRPNLLDLGIAVAAGALLEKEVHSKHLPEGLRLGGIIEVAIEGEGCGATFTVKSLLDSSKTKK